MKSSLHRKLIRGLVILLIWILAIACVNLYASRVLQRQLNGVAALGLKKADLLAEMDEKVAQQHSLALRHLGSASTSELQRDKAALAQGDAEIAALLDSLETTLQTREELNRLTDVRSTWQAYASVRDQQWLPSSSADDKLAALELVTEEGALGAALDGTLHALQELRAVSVTATEQMRAQTVERFENGHTILLFLTIAAIIACLFFGISLSSQLSGRLRVIVDTAQLMAAGDLDWSATVKGGDELESLAEALNRTARNMKRMLAAKRETSEQLQREQADLKESKSGLAIERRRFALTLALVNDAVVAADREGNVAAMNRAAEKLTGWNAEEATGQPLCQVCQIVNAQTRERCTDPLQRIVESGGLLSFAGEIALVSKTGGEHAVTIGSIAIHDPDEGLVGAVLVFRETQPQVNEELDS